MVVRRTALSRGAVYGLLMARKASPIRASAQRDHDDLYRRLFSDPQLVAQLVREFVAGPWLEDLDLDAMRPMPTKFHFRGRRRESDKVWRIPRRSLGHAHK